VNPNPRSRRRSPSAAIGIVDDDLGQSVPPPGMVRLGVVDSGLDIIGSAGNRFTVRIYPVDRTRS